MIIRKLELTDLSQFIELRFEALQEAPEVFASTYQREVKLPQETFVKRLRNTDTQFTIGAFESGQLVCVAAFFKSVGEKTKHKGNIVAVYCKPEFRQLKIATRVMETLIEEVKKINEITILNLSVVSKNKRAKIFYESLGFVVYGMEPQALFDGQNYFDEYLLQLKLN
ncbi:N-acetyltransferase family protein [Enterococcus saccharolyticus]|uniref:GNAT family N-acetyltransferase n=1 Tax=Enterococcus saccharolyticus TaxID=41997 RepID=UPI0039E144CF